MTLNLFLVSAATPASYLFCCSCLCDHFKDGNHGDWGRGRSVCMSCLSGTALPGYFQLQTPWRALRIMDLIQVGVRPVSIPVGVRIRPTICTRKKKMSPDAPNGSQRKGSYSDCRSVSQGVFWKKIAKLNFFTICHRLWRATSRPALLSLALQSHFCNIWWSSIRQESLQTVDIDVPARPKCRIWCFWGRILWCVCPVCNI